MDGAVATTRARSPAQRSRRLRQRSESSAKGDRKDADVQVRRSRNTSRSRTASMKRSKSTDQKTRKSRSIQANESVGSEDHISDSSDDVVERSSFSAVLAKILAAIAPSDSINTHLLSKKSFFELYEKIAHQWEIPRKTLHAVIGFMTISLYKRGLSASDVHPKLAAGFLFVGAFEVFRFRHPKLNDLYCKVLYSLMRDYERTHYNGVLYYLLGSWFVLRFFPLDIAVTAILLLSWCDTAAASIGKKYGKYGPMIRRNKSLIGSLAGVVVGATATWFFYGSVARPDDVRLIYKPAENSFSLSVFSLISGLVGAASELCAVCNIDDNLSIPVISAFALNCIVKLGKRLFAA